VINNNNATEGNKILFRQTLIIAEVPKVCGALDPTEGVANY